MTNNLIRFLIPAATLGLAACGGSSGGGNNTDLGTTDAVAKQVSSLVAATTNVTADGSARRKTHGGCDSGSESSIQESGVNVGSPYTSQPFDLFGERYDNCRFNQDENNYIIFDGESLGGEVTENNDFVEYFRFGDGSSPFSFTVHSQEGGSSSDLTFNFDLVFHGREASSSNDFDGEIFMIYDGEFGSSGITSDFRLRLGTADAAGSRFVVSESASGTTIDGDYEIRLDNAIDSQLECSARANIATNQPLVMNDSTTLYSAGRMTFTAGSQQASVTFNSNDTVTINTASGSETISQSELLNRGQQCSGLLAAGFGFF